jgi:predicted nucleic acid-binding protein
MKSVIDSSVWIEQMRVGFPRGELLQVMEDTSRLVVPTITLLEVRKYMGRYGMPQQTANVLGWMMSGHVVDLTADLALNSASAGLEHKLALGDCIIYATATAHGATLWTMDAHFSNLPGVRMVKPPATSGGRRGG